MGQVLNFSAQGRGGVKPPPPSVTRTHDLALAEAGLLNAFANLSNVLAKLITPPTSIPVGAEIIVEGREILHAMTSAHRELGRIEAAGDDEARRVVASFRDLHLRIQHWEHLYLGR